MLTINAEINKEEKRGDKTYNVKLRFTLNRKIKRLSTNLFVTPKDLTKDLKIKESAPIYREVDEDDSDSEPQNRLYKFFINILYLFYTY